MMLDTFSILHTKQGAEACAGNAAVKGIKGGDMTDTVKIDYTYSVYWVVRLIYGYLLNNLEIKAMMKCSLANDHGIVPSDLSLTQQH